MLTNATLKYLLDELACLSLTYLINSFAHTTTLPFTYAYKTYQPVLVDLKNLPDRYIGQLTSTYEKQSVPYLHFNRPGNLVAIIVDFPESVFICHFERLTFSNHFQAS